MRILFLLMFLFSCTQLGYKPYASRYQEARCLKGAGHGHYDTEKECLESDAFKMAVEKHKTENTYQIIKSPYYVGQFDCERKLDMSKESVAASKEDFPGLQACLYSEEKSKLEKKALMDHEKKRIRDIDSFIKSHPQYSSFQGIANEGRIKIGMPRQLAILSWGKPNKINESVGSYGKHEQWVYPANYLYIKNGVVTSWQSSN